MRCFGVVLAILLPATAVFAQQIASAPTQSASAPQTKHAAALLDTTPPARCTNPDFLSCTSLTEEQCAGAYARAVAEVNEETLKEIGDKMPSDQDLRFHRSFAMGKFMPYFLSHAKLRADTFMRCNQQK